MKLQGALITMAMSLAATGIALADSPTAFTLMKTGDQFVGDQSKDKVVQIRSEKSISDTAPNIWYVDYYDPDATFKSVEVKFGGGAKMDVSHPGRIIEMATDEHKPFDMSLLKVDSDRAISIATSQPVINGLDITGMQLRLDHGELGPVWRVKLWASQAANNKVDVDIGEVVVSATDGSVVANNLHPNSLN